MHALLAEHGLRVVDNLGPAQIAERYARVTSTRTRGAHVVHAIKRA